MNRRSTLGIVAMAALGLMLPASGHAQNAQQRPPAAAEQKPPAPAAPPKSMKEAIVGTWNVLIIDDVKSDGTHVPAYGPNPIGSAIFTADGRYSVQIMRAARPKFASNNRTTGTPDENKAAVQGALAHFGTYSVNEADKTLMLRIEGSTFPNWDGTQQKRIITSLTAGDEVTWTNPTPSTGAGRTELAWKWAK
jgi:hypothetical protein